jgi:hypothetical protein
MGHQTAGKPVPVEDLDAVTQFNEPSGSSQSGWACADHSDTLLRPVANDRDWSNRRVDTTVASNVCLNASDIDWLI